MSENLQDSVSVVGEGLSTSWIELSNDVKNKAKQLAHNASTTALSAEANALADQASKLSDHVDRLHADVAGLLNNLEDRPILPAKSGDVPKEELEEAIQINREHHEARSDIKDVVKALFMWRDDPAERVRSKE